MGYREKVAIATMMESMGKKKKKAQLRKDIEQAKEQGYDVTIKYDPTTGEYSPTFSYKQPTKTQAEKDAELFQLSAEQGYGGGFSQQEITSEANRNVVRPTPGVAGSRSVTMGQTKQGAGLKQAQQFRKPYEQAGYTMVRGTDGNWKPVKKTDVGKNLPGGFKGTPIARDKLIGDLKSRNITKRHPKTGIEIDVLKPTRQDAINHLREGGAINWRQDQELVQLVMSYPEAKGKPQKKRISKRLLTEENIQATMKEEQITRQQLMDRLEVID